MDKLRTKELEERNRIASQKAQERENKANATITFVENEVESEQQQDSPEDQEKKKAEMKGDLSEETLKKYLINEGNFLKC